MDIKLLHLYADLMNLYGEYGNVTALKKHLEDQGAAVTVTTSETAANLDFTAFDCIYTGSGTEQNQKAALADLYAQKEAFAGAVQNGTVMLFTGNAFEMLGKSITDWGGKVYDGLRLAEFETMEQNEKRLTGDCYCVCDFLKEPLVGFINKCSESKGIETPLFDMQMGFGNSMQESLEGLRLQSLFATHIIGPLLIKNPHFMEYMVTLICTRCNPDFILTPKEYPYEQNAYRVTRQKLYGRMNKET